MSRAIWKGHISFGLVEIPISVVDLMPLLQQSMKSRTAAKTGSATKKQATKRAANSRPPAAKKATRTRKSA